MIEWGSPPPIYRRTDTFRETFRILKERPGEWAKIDVSKRRARAEDIYRYCRREGFQSATRKLGAEQYAVYAMWPES